MVRASVLCFVCTLLVSPPTVAGPRVKSTGGSSKAGAAAMTQRASSRAKASARSVRGKNSSANSKLRVRSGKGVAMVSARERAATPLVAKTRRRLPTLSMKARTAKQLSYSQSPITTKQVKAIEKVVKELQAKGGDQVILFRGQEQRTKKVESEVVRKHGSLGGARAYDKAAKAEADAAAKTVAETRSKRFPSRYDETHSEHLSGMTGHELLAIKGQDQFASAYVVSATRNLSIAFGDFYKAPTVRYLYILQVPKSQVLNVHGLVAEKVKTMNLPAPKNQREKEVAIPLAATEFVRAVYDIQAGKMISL